MRCYHFAIYYALCMSLAACSLDSPKYSSNTPSLNNTQIPIIQPALMMLDGQQRDVRGGFKCFYISSDQTTDEHISVSIQSDSCPKAIKYSFATSTWQLTSEGYRKKINTADTDVCLLTSKQDETVIFFTNPTVSELDETLIGKVLNMVRKNFVS